MWHVPAAFPQIKFRFLGLLPALYLPGFFFLYPPRTGAHFREEIALFNSNGWLKLRLGAGVTVEHLFLALLALATFYFLFREAAPSVKHYLRRHHSLPPIDPGQFPKLDSVLARLAKTRALPIPLVLLSTEEGPVIHTLGRRALVLSATAINMLDSEELEAVIAHELAHLSGQAYGISQASLILRFLMFYNPVALLLFRVIINDNEKNCDDIAVRAVGKRLALASALFKVFRQTAMSPAPSGVRSRFLPWVSSLERRAHQELIKERAERLVQADKTNDIHNQNVRLAVLAGLLAALLFFVV